MRDTDETTAPIRSFEQIAKRLANRPYWRGITSEGVRYHHDRAIKKLRKKLETDNANH